LAVAAKTIASGFHQTNPSLLVMSASDRKRTEEVIHMNVLAAGAWEANVSWEVAFSH